MIYLVKSKFSNFYTSINTVEYYEKLMYCIDKPWYYVYYDYTLHDNTHIPCNSIYQKVHRSALNTDDKELYHLHLQAVKLARHNSNFYWLIDSALDDKFSLFWKKVLREKHDKINQENI